MFVNVPMAARALVMVWRVAAAHHLVRGGRPDAGGAVLAAPITVTTPTLSASSHHRDPPQAATPLVDTSPQEGHVGMTVTPIDLFAPAICLGHGGMIHGGKGTTDFDQDGRRLPALHAETGADVHADHGEVHPEGEEIMSCPIGNRRRLRAGTAAIVPRGRWHRTQVDIPGEMRAVTLPRRSRLEKRTEAESGGGMAMEGHRAR
ncbi:hypothetical protein [Nonomuraea indica]|uniref:hypothetical protein n=1 Tax=Nonomuraea indica TaxID=1581193 RepID=UPI001FEBD11A|nr:hypothetical protein [Nonomuraea indica]